ncbi:MAG: class II aldolase/adducin family protein [Bacteroidota bacterium]
MNEEGVIKFNCNWVKAAALPNESIAELNEWRDKLYNQQLIGENNDGIGYGNISCRYSGDNFVITGSGTGSLKKLGGDHYSKVTAYDFAKNTLTTVGPLKASSESLTHAAIYESLADASFVFHIHHPALWKELMKEGLFTSSEAEYGTPAMALEIIRVMKEPLFLKHGIFAMGGHEEGVIAFGKTAAEAGKAIESWLGKL